MVIQGARRGPAVKSRYSAASAAGRSALSGGAGSSSDSFGRITVWGLFLVADLGKDFARHLCLALAVPHAGIEAAARQQLRWVPRSTITPWSSTNISSAPTMVESRCAMTRVVRFLATRSSSSWMSRSVWLSSAEVASSSKRIGGDFQNGAGDGDALLLAAGEFEAAFAHFGVVAFRRLPDEAVDLRLPRGLLDLGVARVPAAVADIVADGVVEQHGVLRHHSDRRAERALRDIADVLAVDQDASAGHFVEAE